METIKIKDLAVTILEVRNEIRNRVNNLGDGSIHEYDDQTEITKVLKKLQGLIEYIETADEQIAMEREVLEDRKRRQK